MDDDRELDLQIIGKALAATVKPRPNVIDLDEDQADTNRWILSGQIRPKPKT